MAAKKPEVAPEAVEQPAEGCVFMYRDTLEGGIERAEVDVASGSVEIMTELGWREEA